MKKLLYYDQDSARIRTMSKDLSKQFEVFIASDLLELAGIMKDKNPTVLLLGFASNDDAFNIRHLECIRRSIQIVRTKHSEAIHSLILFIMLESQTGPPVEKSTLTTREAECVEIMSSLSFCEVHIVHLPIPMKTLSSMMLATANTSPIGCMRKNGDRTPPNLFADKNSPIIGKSKTFCHMIAQIHSYADELRPVLIIGETGTGKELAARSLHSWSKRKYSPFVALNCAAIPEPLFESEMFGTERGAYTDASTRKGAIEQADNGTLFLDEIGSLMAVPQASLLRALGTGEYRRLGGANARSVHFRLVSASCLNPIHLAEEKRFRDDLLFRITDFVIEIPPLRERRDDIPLLANYFCNQFSKDMYDIEDDALDKLSSHDWPGNIRELRSVIARACAKKEEGKISVNDIEFLTDISGHIIHKL